MSLRLTCPRQVLGGRITETGPVGPPATKLVKSDAYARVYMIVRCPLLIKDISSQVSNDQAGYPEAGETQIAKNEVGSRGGQARTIDPDSRMR